MTFKTYTNILPQQVHLKLNQQNSDYTQISRKLIKSSQSLIKSESKKKQEDILTKQEVKKESKEINKMVKGKNDELEKFILLVATLIEKNKVYPKKAKYYNLEGSVEVELTLSASGEIITFKTLENNTSDILVSAAKRLISSISQYPQIPKILKLTKITIIIPIEYKLL